MNLDTSKPIKSVSYNGVNVPLFQEAPVLLWTNASPTSNFAGQSISFSGSGYSRFILEVRMTTSASTYYTWVLPTSSSSAIYTAFGTYSDNNYARNITAITPTTMTFGNGIKSMMSQSSYNGYAVPTRIWGVKFTL